MKLPNYLKVILLATLGLTLFSFFIEDGDEPLPAASTTSLTSKQERLSTKVNDEAIGETVDLFPIFKVNTPETMQEQQAAKNLRPSEVHPPFNPVGIWLSEGVRTVVLSDGQHSWLLCAKCRSPDYVRPGQKIAEQWKLIDLKEEYLVVEWIPEHMRKRIELGSLKLK